jgi:hypothetical protein
MRYVLIFLFFVVLLFFFIASGLWHWVWFGRGVDKISRPAARRFARGATTLLVLASVLALAVVTYSLIR